MDGPSLLDPVRVVVPKGHVYYGPLLVVRAKSYLDPETSWSYSRVDGLWASVGGLGWARNRARPLAAAAAPPRSP